MVNIKNPQSNLPPGFRFHPTDEELILHYLRKKVTSKFLPVSIIADVDIYKFDPWDLPDKASFGEKEWYFFSPRDRKYPNGARPNRAAASGYWKATGTDKVIVAPPMAPGGLVAGENIGVKKALVFYKGRPPKGVKTNWIMHEYRLADALNFSNHRTMKSKDGSMRLDDWVLCRIYKKSNALCSASAGAAAPPSDQDQEEEEAEQFLKETLFPSLRTTPPPATTLKPQKSCSFSNLLEAVDYSMLSSFLADNPVFDSNAFGAGNLEQGLLSNTYCYSSGSNVLQNVPQHNPSVTVPYMDNRLKRQSSNLDEDSTQQSKKLMGSCSYTNGIGSSQSDVAQYNFVNQNLLLSPYLHFQG